MAVYAVSDLHGRYDLFQKIKDFVKPEDIVYVLGDCADRGKDGWQIIKEVCENPQFIYIKGNHEQILIEAMSGDGILCAINAGQDTYDAWREDGGSLDWINRLESLPLEELYINEMGNRIILCHAGYTPHYDKEVCEDDYLWDRTHFNAQWDAYFNNTFIIHGHTPVPYIDEFLYPYKGSMIPEAGIFWYSPDENGVNHKCDIDCGAYFTGVTALLNLDTFEQIIIK